jgi:hypothetical protein
MGAFETAFAEDGGPWVPVETRKYAVVAMLLREKVKGEFCFTHS